MPGNGQNYRPFSHHDVFSLAYDLEPSFLKRCNRSLMRNPRYFGQTLDSHFGELKVEIAFRRPGNFEVFANRALDVLNRLGFGSALRPTSGQSWTLHRVPLFRFDEDDRIPHAPSVAFGPFPAGIE